MDSIRQDLGMCHAPGIAYANLGLKALFTES
jgi:hypothetical protein